MIPGPTARPSVLIPLMALIASPVVVALCAHTFVGASVQAAAPMVAASTGLAAFVAAFLLWRASRQNVGRAKSLHRRLALGCAIWGLGVLPYLAFVARGGDMTSPSAWTQIGFLVAYVPWMSALWTLRQPVIAENRRRILEVLLTEAAAFSMISLAVLAALWDSSLPASTNVALLVPVCMDLVLLAAAYNAVRRASLRVDALYGWMVAAFAVMGTADALVTIGVVGAPNAVLLVLGNLAYISAFALMATGAGRHLHLRESSLAGERLTVAVGAIGLAMAAPAASLTPPMVSRVVWFVGALLSWRLFCVLRELRGSDQDRLTGMWDARALTRHAGPLVSMASEAHPVALVAVDLSGFGRWNAEQGFVEGDALLTQFADSLLEVSSRPGAWGRIGPDRFCWVGSVRDVNDARSLARRVVEATAADRGGLDARAGVVVCPIDAATAENALAAAEEALEAARSTAGGVVCFDSGLLEGANASVHYSASYRSRRQRVQDLLEEPGRVESVFQPIVTLHTLDVIGYEALSRMNAEPRQGPDWWIAEAQHVDLGVELEAVCVRRAIGSRRKLRPDRYMAVNASPSLIMSGLLDELFPNGPLDWLLLEITEHDMVRDYAELSASLRGVRSRGARIAVDDLGAGNSTLAHVTRLCPDVAKLDRSIVEGVDGDFPKQAMVRSMVAFSRETGCSLVAEGIETPAEWATLRELGVEHGQGYLFQPPSGTIVGTVRLRHQLLADGAPIRKAA